MSRSNDSAPDDIETEQALRETRSRFVAGFTQRHAAMVAQLESLTSGHSAPLEDLRASAHKMAGLAGTIGFPNVSESASALETALLAQPIDRAAATGALASLAAGFATDLARPMPAWATERAAGPTGARILLVEDDDDQRRIAAASLRAAGFHIATAVSGPDAMQIARTARPDLILLDVDLPGLDGMAVCRELKLDPALGAVPVIFCTARAGVMDRVAGLALGADDYVTKPFAPGEILIRIRRLLLRRKPSAAPGAPPELLTYSAFAAAAHDALSQGGAAVVLVRVAAADVERVAARLISELRRRDLVGRFNDDHLVLLTPGMTAAMARAAVQHATETVTPRLGPLDIGAVDGAPGERVERLLADADLALARDRIARVGDSGKPTVLLAEDDPDVLRIMDARLRAAGYRTVMSLDGQQTLADIEQESPRVVLLDLMMPKLTGFDVLTRLRERKHRPKTIVVSARGREDDVTRAFDLGADDYVTKPFNPDELVARVARLIR